MTTDQRDLPAGRFSSWLLEVGTAQQVPCGTCTACCTSSQFVHICPDEAETVAQIPPELLFPAPGRPRGHVLLGYDENGHCPMFVDGRCSIYECRPRTCRAYDCRVLAAAGLEPDDEEKARIAERVRRWRFGMATPLDATLRAAVEAAASFLRDHADELPVGAVPRNPTQLAFLAVSIHDVFVEPGEDPDELRLATPPLDVIEAALLRCLSSTPP